MIKNDVLLFSLMVGSTAETAVETYTLESADAFIITKEHIVVLIVVLLISVHVFAFLFYTVK